MLVMLKMYVFTVVLFVSKRPMEYFAQLRLLNPLLF